MLILCEVPLESDDAIISSEVEMLHCRDMQESKKSHVDSSCS